MADYTTVTKVKDRLTDLQGDATYDIALGDFITQCSAEIDRLTGRFFSLQAGAVRTFDGDGTRIVLVPDLSAVTQLRVKVGGTQGSFTVVSSSDYFLEPATRRTGYPAQWIELSDSPLGPVSRFDTGKRTVEITGDWGWASVPVEIAGVCLDEVVQSWRERGGRRDPGTGMPGNPTPGPWLFSRRSLSVLESYGYRAPIFA